MAIRFRKSKKVGPVKLNLSKSGISASVGGKAAGISTGKRGTNTRVSIPGTGISFTKKIK